MTVALCATAIVVIALLWEVMLPYLERRRERRRAAREARAAGEGIPAYDPGRERRAEQRARELLKSCVNEEEWEMYRDLGLIRVWGGESLDKELRGVPYAYLIYPHKPIVAYLPQTGRLLNEYCVEFPDESKPYGSARLPDSDDVLAKWMALKGDERRLISSANMHLPGRQVDPRQVQRDIWRLGRWERERLERHRRASSGAAAGRRRLDDHVRRRERSLRPQASLTRAHRGPRPRRRARVPEGHRLRRRGAEQADHRRRQHVDRDDAVQLPPARAGQARQGRHQGRRRHADGVQHGRDLRRHHDGHRAA